MNRLNPCDTCNNHYHCKRIIISKAQAELLDWFEEKLCFGIHEKIIEKRKELGIK